MTLCKGCGREIIWATTQHGKSVPLDPKALVFSVMMHDHKLIAVKPTRLDGEQFYVSHFATCPKAADFSGRGKDADSRREND